MSKINNILISGINGFVGINLKSYLLKDKKYNINQFIRDNEKSFIIKDEMVIHLAGKAHDLKNASNPEEYYAANFELTKKIYNAFLQSESKKFIFISSVKACKDVVIGKLTEEEIPDPKTHYGKSKLLAEQYILSQPLPDDKSFFILRPCMIHGPGNKGNLNLLYKIVSKGIPWPLGTFENKRSFLSVQNLCFIIQELLERDDIPSGIYNVADDKSISTNELIEIISSELKIKKRILYLPKKFITALATIGDVIKFPLNSERLQKLTENYEVSNQKILKAINKPLPYSSEEGLRKTISSFLNN